MRSPFSLLFLLFFLIISCQKEEENTPPVPSAFGTIAPRNVDIDPQLQKYVDRFFAEAKERGLRLNESDLEVVFLELEEYCGLGYAMYNNTLTRRVEIDPNCWKDRSESWKEWLMFHELGHAVLRRPHANAILPNGSAKSIMCGTGVGYEKCVGHSTSPYSIFTPIKRKYYIDELFDPAIAKPMWGEIKSRGNGTIVFQEDFEEGFDWELRLRNDSISSSTYMANIEFDESKNTNVATLNSNALIDVNAIFTTSFKPTFIKEGAILELKATIRTENVIGDGVALALRINSKNEEYFDVSGWDSTQDVTPIKGTMSREYSLIIPYYPSDVDYGRIFLLFLPNSKGKVSIDDIVVTAYE